MKPDVNWQINYDNEIEHAILARLNGNEGMARVCARRATGILIGEYLMRRGHAPLSNSIFERMSLFLSLPGVDSRYQEIVKHFMMKVDNEHNLPVVADLISEAQWLFANLLLEKSS